MKQLMLLFFFFLPVIRNYGQNSSIDSLKNLLAHANADSGRISILSKISDAYYNDLNKKDTAILMTRECLRLAEQQQLSGWEIKNLIRLGNQYSGYRHHDSARLAYSKALHIAEQHNFYEDEITVLGNLSDLYDVNNPDSSFFWIQKALTLAHTNSFKEREIGMLIKLIDSRGNKFLKDSLQQFFSRGLWLCSQLNDRKDSLLLLLNFARASETIGNYPLALQKFIELLDIYKQDADTTGISSALYYIGRLYIYEQNYKQSLNYLYSAKNIINNNAKGMRLYYLMFITDHIAGDYVTLHRNDSALFYAERSYSLGKIYYGENMYGGLLNDLGIIYFDLGKDSIALSYLRRSYAALIRIGDGANICETGIGLGKVFKKTGRGDSSFFYARRTLAIAQKLSLLNYISDASTLLTDYFKTKNIDSAFFYQQIGIAAYDSLYTLEKENQFQNLTFTEQQKEQDIEAAKKITEIQYRNNLKVYALIASLLVFLLIASILYRNNISKQKAFSLLQKQKQEIDLQKTKVEHTLSELKSTQSQLIQSEKMASLGELTAGIAHEIQNPLNFVNNFSDVNKELLAEMKDEMNKGNIDDAKEIANDVISNEEKINHHGKRADAIVKGMLQHSRTSTGVKEPTDINSLADEYLRLAYHGLRAKDKGFNATTNTDFDLTIGTINIIPQDIGRVLLNLYNNAFYAVNEKKKAAEANYEPTVSVSTKKSDNGITISVKDNGNGIPQKVVDKIFQPFFTTKPTGQGTGLGLSLSYDIVKAHGGDIKVETKEGEGSEFVVQLPAN